MTKKKTFDSNLHILQIRLEGRRSDKQMMASNTGTVGQAVQLAKMSFDENRVGWGSQRNLSQPAPLEDGISTSGTNLDGQALTDVTQCGVENSVTRNQLEISIDF